MFPPECQREIAAGIAGSQLVITTEPATPQGRTESRGNPSPADVPGREGSLGFEWLSGIGGAPGRSTIVQAQCRLVRVSYISSFPVMWLRASLAP